MQSLSEASLFLVIPSGFSLESEPKWRYSPSVDIGFDIAPRLPLYPHVDNDDVGR